MQQGMKQFMSGNIILWYGKTSLKNECGINEWNTDKWWDVALCEWSVMQVFNNFGV